MTIPLDLTPLSQLELNQEHILAIKRNDLLPLITDPHRLNHYADHLVQAQSVLLNGVDPKLNQQLSESDYPDCSATVTLKKLCGRAKI